MEVYAIKDLNDYASQLRQLSAKSISENYTENLDDFITLGQLISLIMEKSQGFDENNHILIDEETNEDLFYIVCDWIYGVGLSRLASQNLVECAWDDQQNCMVFWSPKNTENSDESKSTTNFGD
jgi:hypothetical protein